METLLEIKNLAVSYFTYAGEVHSVRDVSFTIEKGKTMALVGESGCGKTVTAKSVMGLIKKPGRIKEHSEILYCGENIADYNEKSWNQFRGVKASMIFQDALVSLNPTVTVGRQIVENLTNHNKDMSREEKYRRAEEMLTLVEIPDPAACMKKYPHELSGGMRQRVMIAMAMVTHPELLVADEPTTALDVTVQAQIIELMKHLQQTQNMAILIITHDMGVVADIADDIAVMYAGKIVEKGPVREIFYHPQHPYTWALLKSVPRIDLTGQEELMSIEGVVPDMIHPPKGCAFCQRCPFAMNICKEYEPEMQCVGENHMAACWLMDKRADRTGVDFLAGGGENV